MTPHILGNAQFKSFMATSNPRKHAALAGKALIMTGDRPLNIAPGPSVRILKKTITLVNSHH